MAGRRVGAAQLPLPVLNQQSTQVTAAAAAAAELSAEQAEMAAKQAEAAAKEKMIADALNREDAEMAAIDAMNEEELLANLDADELAAFEAELAELEG
jgi:hypothetical protein